MRALVIYESMFGNTQAVAQAVADGIRECFPAAVVEIEGAPSRLDSDVSLLVVGAPTHAFGLSRPSTRADARKQGATGSADASVRDWLDAASSGRGLPAAAFDTKVDRPRLPGSAAHAIERRLRRSGYRIVRPSESFYVRGTKGPLVDDELTRAHAWGRVLAEHFTTQIPV